MVVLTGCASRPTAELAGVGLDSLDLTSATLRFDVKVTNPYPVALPLANLDYNLASNAASFLSGQADLQGTVPALGTKTVSLPAKITYRELLAALKGVTPGQVVPYKAVMGLSVKSPVGGALRLPLEKEGQLPVPAVPDVKVESITWSNLSLEEAKGVIKLHVTNPNQFALDVAKIDYALNLGGAEVAKSALASATKLAASGGSGTVDIPITFSPKNLGLGAVKMLSGSGGGYGLSGALSVNTPFGPMTLPLSAQGTTLFRR
jgi:LEA14-like dessication related protein